MQRSKRVLKVAPDGFESGSGTGLANNFLYLVGADFTLQPSGALRILRGQALGDEAVDEGVVIAANFFVEIVFDPAALEEIAADVDESLEPRQWSGLRPDDIESRYRLSILD